MNIKKGKKRLLSDLTWGQATFSVFLAVAGFFLWTEHRAHVLGALPYLIFLLCPLMHIFMHRRHNKQDNSAEWHKQGTNRPEKKGDQDE